MPDLSELNGSELLEMLDQASARLDELALELERDAFQAMALNAVMSDHDITAAVQAMISESPEIAADYLRLTADLAAAVRMVALIRDEMNRRAQRN